MVKVAICGEAYSHNLGDGVIADSLRWLLEQSDSTMEGTLVDFSGRAGFCAENPKASDVGALRSVHRWLLKTSIYRRFSIPLFWYSHKRSKMRALWLNHLKESNIILIGGGQLLMGNHLGFILRITELLRIARTLDKDVVFFSCGVGSKWSWFGKRLLLAALNDERVKWVSVRDTGSKDTLHDLLGQRCHQVHKSMDPAVVASEAYAVSAQPNTNVVGLGISAPSELNWATVQHKSAYTDGLVKDFWLGLADLLIADDVHIALFTNGLPDDYAFAETLMFELSKRHPQAKVSLKARARTPRELVTQISQFRAIVAHRLHANIVAYSLGIPAVGIVWDAKVAEFAKMTGRCHFSIGALDMIPTIVRDRLYEAISIGVDPVNLAEHKKSLQISLQSMLLSTGPTVASSDQDRP